MKETLSSVNRHNQKKVSCGKSPKGYGFAYFAIKDIKPGEVVSCGFGRITHHQTSHFSIQVGPNTHIVPFKWTGKYWNHSCNPNCYVKTRENGFPSLVASRPIKKGDEITYAYYMTEMTWSEEAVENKIKCKCRSWRCRGKIFSFLQLSHREKVRSLSYVASYLQNLE